MADYRVLYNGRRRRAPARSAPRASEGHVPHHVLVALGMRREPTPAEPFEASARQAAHENSAGSYSTDVPDCRPPLGRFMSRFDGIFLFLYGPLVKLLIGLAVAAAAIALVCIASLPGQLIPARQAVEAAMEQGYTDVRVIDSDRISPGLSSGCAKGDDAAFELSARNQQGDTVTIIACCDLVSETCGIRSRGSAPHDER